MEAYAKRRATAPFSFDFARWADEPSTTTEVRLLAVELLRQRALSPAGPDQENRDALRRLSRDGRDATVRKAAADALADAEATHLKRQQDSKRRDEERRQRERKEYAFFSDVLAKGRFGDRELDERTRGQLAMLVAIQRLRIAADALTELAGALRDYATAHNGLLPRTLQDLSEKAPMVPDCQVLYFRTEGVRLADVPNEVLLAVAGPFKQHLDSEMLSLALAADGKPRDLLASKFYAAWNLSNAARQKVGLPPIDASELGPLEAWARPGGATSLPATRPTTLPATKPATQP
jgi:hypothetical protein